MKILMLSLLLLLLLLFLEFIVVEIEIGMFVVVEKFVVVVDGDEEIVVVCVDGIRFIEKEIVDGDGEFVVIICCESTVYHVLFKSNR